MLNPCGIKGVLSENVDENASHYVLFTTYGTLLGHDETIDVKFTRKFAAFVGATWRRLQVRLDQTATPDLNISLHGVRVLSFETVPTHNNNNNERHLLSMLVRSDNIVAAISPVDAELLLAVQLEIENLDQDLPEEMLQLSALDLGTISDNSEVENPQSQPSSGAASPNTTTNPALPPHFINDLSISTTLSDRLRHLDLDITQATNKVPTTTTTNANPNDNNNNNNNNANDDDTSPESVAITGSDSSDEPKETDRKTRNRLARLRVMQLKAQGMAQFLLVRIRQVKEKMVVPRDYY